jgi:hypothetical protein
VTGSGTGTLHFNNDIWVPLGVAFQVVVWLAALGVLVRRRRIPGRRRLRSGRAGTPVRLAAGEQATLASHEVQS